jgi:hypothetical protein
MLGYTFHPFAYRDFGYCDFEIGKAAFCDPLFEKLSPEDAIFLNFKKIMNVSLELGLTSL